MANANEERKEVRFWGALKMLAVLILVVFTHNRLPTTLIEVGSFSRVEIKKKKQRKQQLFQWPNNPPEMPHWPPPPIPTTMRAITTVTASTTWSYAPFASTQSSRTGPEPWFGLAAGIGSIWVSNRRFSVCQILFCIHFCLLFIYFYICWLVLAARNQKGSKSLVEIWIGIFCFILAWFIYLFFWDIDADFFLLENEDMEGVQWWFLVFWLGVFELFERKWLFWKWLQWWSVRNYDPSLCVIVDPRTSTSSWGGSQKQKIGFTLVDDNDIWQWRWSHFQACSHLDGCL